MAEESASDHEPSLLMNTSSCEHEVLREPGYEADHEFSSDDCRGNELCCLLLAFLSVCFILLSVQLLLHSVGQIIRSLASV